MNISVVTTSYNSSKNIKEFVSRIKNLFDHNNFQYEIIIVDDGSIDESVDLIRNIQKSLDNITLIELSRNFGHQPAIRCGLEHAKGDLIYLIDSDLEEEPELFNIFYEELKNNKLDLVFGQQKIRRGSVLEKISGNMFYSFLKYLGGFKIPRNLITARLMTKKFLNGYLKFNEKDFFLGGITKLTGFKQKGIYVSKIRNNKTSYTMSKKFDVLVRSIANYSPRLLYIVFCAGLIISSLSFILVLYLVFRYFFTDIAVSGWLTIVSLILLGTGISILSNGILAIYLKTIFTEVKGRPSTIIKNIYKKNNF